MADDVKQGSGNGDTHRYVSWSLVLSAVATMLAVLAFFGINNVGQLRQKIAAGPTTSPSPASAAPRLGDHPSPGPTSTTFDPDSLDDRSTDKTPFRQAALLADAFTNRLGIKYKRVADGVHGCTDAYAMNSDVRNVLSDHGCTTTVTGEYQVDSTGATDSNDILVSVQVFAFDNSSTADEVYGSLSKEASGSAGVWCPLTGRGHNVCTSGYENAFKISYTRAYHRYVIATTALYTNLIYNVSNRPWVDAAASKASEVCGPQNYTHD